MAKRLTTRTLSPAEHQAALEIASHFETHASLLGAATRLRDYLSARAAGLDEEVRERLLQLEASLLAELGRLPAADGAQLREKSGAFARRPAIRDNLAAMLVAAVEADAARLGLGPGRMRCSVCGKLA